MYISLQKTFIIICISFSLLTTPLVITPMETTHTELPHSLKEIAYNTAASIGNNKAATSAFLILPLIGISKNVLHSKATLKQVAEFTYNYPKTSVVICGIPALAYLIRYMSNRFWTTNRFLAEQAKQEIAAFAQAVVPIKNATANTYAHIAQAELRLAEHDQKMDTTHNTLQAIAWDSAQSVHNTRSLCRKAQSGRTYISSLLGDIHKLHPTLQQLTQDQNANTQLIRDLATYDTKIDEHLQNSAELVDAIRTAITPPAQPGDQTKRHRINN
jgi:hypothetical protein